MSVLDPPPGAVQHVCSSAHIFCRLCEEGLSVKEARRWAKRIETALAPVIYPKRPGANMPPEEIVS